MLYTVRYWYDGLQLREADFSSLRVAAGYAAWLQISEHIGDVEIVSRGALHGR